MISFSVHCRVQMFQARRNHLVFCEPMASGPMVPHSSPGLLEDTWSRMPQWSTLVLHHTCTCRRQQSLQVLQLSRLPFARLPNMHCCLQAATHVFFPIAFETLGPVNAEGAEFLSELGRRISSVSGDQRKTTFLLQRLSICVQRHNSIAFRGTFQDGREAFGRGLISYRTFLLVT